MTVEDLEKSPQGHNFRQHSTFASERPQFRTWGTPNVILAPDAS